MISHLKDSSGLTWAALAEKVGTNKDTLASYTKKLGHVKSVVLENLIVQYRYSSVWLMEGKGEPYPGARTEHPEVCGPAPLNIKESPSPQAPADVPIPDPGNQFMEDISHLKVIYDYGDLEIINAIHSNLKTFNRTVQREIEVRQLKQKVLHLEAENLEIRKENAGLSARLTDLEEKMALFLDSREVKKTANGM